MVIQIKHLKIYRTRRLKTDPELGKFYDILGKVYEDGFEDVEVSRKFSDYESLLDNIKYRLNDNWPTG